MIIYQVTQQHYDLKPGVRLVYQGPCTTDSDCLLMRALTEPLDTAPLFIVPLSKMEKQS